MRKTDTSLISRSDPAVALILLTRLPLPALPDTAFSRQSSAVWAFPLAGLAVALGAATVGWVALALGLPAGAVAGLVVAGQIGLTGAMHEDGLADTADGLWGGTTRERRLEIMQDSRVGTYGVLALIVSVGLRWVALTALIAAGAGWGALIATAALSRAFLPVLMAVVPPARPDGLSRGVGVPGRPAVLLALGLGLAIAALTAGSMILIPALAAALAVAGLAGLANRRIGGQTGDILGAAQQVAEIIMLVGLSAGLAA